MATYPNGLKKTLALFSRATYDILNSREIEKVAKSASRQEKKYIELLKEATTGLKPESFIFWALYPYLVKCPHLLCDIFAEMVMLDRDIFTENELAELYADLKEA